jgi:hypothetical protein
MSLQSFNTRQKHIKIEDGSPAGWKTVQECQLNIPMMRNEKEVREIEPFNRHIREETDISALFESCTSGRGCLPCSAIYFWFSTAERFETSKPISSAISFR